MATGIAHFLTPEQLHTLGRLVLESRYVVEGSLAGAHRSAQRGTSTEFADHRQYIQGDDPKHIDWKVLARTDRHYIRRYEDETNLRVYLVVDRSASMKYKHKEKDITKYEYACRLAAALGYVVVKARDSVGLYLHSDKIDAKMDARNSFSHLNDLLRRLQEAEPAESTNIADALHRIADSITRRAMIVILSDLFDDSEAITQALAHFRKQHHDVILFQVLDQAELDLPFNKGARFEDMETGEIVSCDPGALRESYQRVLAEFMAGYQDAATALNIDYRVARTNQTLDNFVRAYLDERRRFSK